MRWLLAGVALGLGVAVQRAVRQALQTDLHGQVAVITGGSRGLGLALARELAREGCRIVLSARDMPELERARGDVESLGAEVMLVQSDVSERGQVAKLIAQSMERFGQIDILINDAGLISVGPLDTQTLEDFERAMATMFWGMAYATFEVLPHMRQRRSGHIVNITSVGGKLSVPHLLPYSTAKFAAVGFSEGLHAELRQAGIRVLTVVPGLMRTGSHINAEFRGKQQREFGWFSLAASLPITSIDAGRAARQIVSGIKSGEAEVILTWQAAIATRVHGLMPGVTAQVMVLVERLLPDADGGSREARPGRQSRSGVSDSALTVLGERAADDLNER